MPETRTIGDLVAPFASAVADGKVEVYNEFGLQHELGIYLRSALPELKVQIERNVHFFFPEGQRGDQALLRSRYCCRNN